MIHSADIFRVALALMPVLVFLAALRSLDSYKLVSLRVVLISLGAGAVAAVVCFFINSVIFGQFPGFDDQYARFGAPVIEELAKSVYWIFLIATARVAFMAEAGICGFAIGAGFALVENITFLHLLAERGIGVWILRGFGTAVMHGGVAAVGAALSVYLLETRKWTGILLFAPCLFTAILLHSSFNQSLESPVASLIAVVVCLPMILGVVFYLSERSLREWLGGKLDQDIDLLSDINSGEFQKTRVGAYLIALRETFPPAVQGDMLSLLQLSSELSMRAKSDLLLREAGLELEPDPELDSLFAEMKYLEKSIGPTGMLAIRPLLSQTPRDLWEMHRLGRGTR